MAKPKPLLATAKKPNPTRTTQCLTALLDGKGRSKRKRNEAEEDEQGSSKRRQELCPRAPPAPMTAKRPATWTASTNRIAIDVFGGMKSGSLERLGLASKTAQSEGLDSPPIFAEPRTRQGRKHQPTTRRPELTSTLKQPTVISVDPALMVSTKISSEKVLLTGDPKASTVVAKKKQKVSPSGYVAPKIRPPPPSSYSSLPFPNSVPCKNPEEKSNAVTTGTHSVSITAKARVAAPIYNQHTFVQSLSFSSTSASLRRSKRDWKPPAIHSHHPPPDCDVSSGAYQSTTIVQSNDSIESCSMYAPHVQPNQPAKRISALEVMPRLSDASEKATTTSSSRAIQKPLENFVRLNLRNANGACHGSRKSNSKKTSKHRKSSTRRFSANTTPPDKTTTTSTRHTTVEGIDPVDDFIDGAFQPAEKTKKRPATIHLCKGHQEPCKLLKVKKSGPNKGRLFYVCPCPRSEQCDHFYWADDTQEAAQVALRKNKSTSGFIARQVAAYMKNIDVLTIPELKHLAQRHHLCDKGKKNQLRTRISIWVRDEIAKGLGLLEQTENDDESESSVVSVAHETDGEENCSVVSTSSSSSEESELELTGPEEKLWDQSTLNVNGSSRDNLSESSNTAFQEDNHMHKMLRSLFGHSKFRPGQEWAISRCISGQRSLLVAPTGSGKSLCYALPAAMKSGVAIVVSPLISLIEDQLRVLPPRLPAATLSGSLTKAATAAILDDVLRLRIKLLFISPEKFVSASFRRLFRKTRDHETGQMKRLFPNVSIFCVDEAHWYDTLRAIQPKLADASILSMSQWAHNFRPCYLRLGTVLQSVEPESVLAITATAEPRVVDDICSRLEISKDEKSLRLLNSNRDNIDVQCLFLGSQEERLSKKSSTQDESYVSDGLDGSLAVGNVIVYVWRQMDAEIVAENIQARGISGGVVVYHGGMDSGARAKAQSKFMRGKCRICVATIAFGLGINKSDVAGVIHMHLSSSPEHYIQEIGRAGRDGQHARAIALILQDEVLLRHSMAHIDLLSVSQCSALLRLLQTRIADAISKLPDNRSKTDPVTISFPLSLHVNGCDCKPETVETILSLFEQREGDLAALLHIEGAFYDRALVAPKREALEVIAETEDVLRSIQFCASCIEPPLGDAYSHDEWSDRRHGANERSTVSGNRFGVYSLSVCECANFMGPEAEPRHVFAALRRLQNNGVIEFDLQAIPQNRCLQIRLTAEGMVAFQDVSIENLVHEAFHRFSATINATSQKVLDLQNIFRLVSNAYLTPPTKLGAKSKGLELFQRLTADYLDGALESTEEAVPDDTFRPPPKAVDIARDAQTALQHLLQVQLSLQSKVAGGLRFGDPGTSDYTSLSITKFLHGLVLPSISPALLRHHPLFGRWQDVRFDRLNDIIKTLFSRSPMAER